MHAEARAHHAAAVVRPEYVTDLDEVAASFDEPARRQFLGDNARSLYRIDS